MMPAGLPTALGRAAADLLWPRRCAGCDVALTQAGAAASPAESAGLLCASCAQTLLPIATAEACPRCAAPLEPRDHDTPLPCPDCQRLQPAFDRVIAAYQYGGALVTALHRLKWEGRDDLARPLGALLARPLAVAAGRCDLIVPVPLHLQRLLARGYNQAGLLAEAARKAAAALAPLSIKVDHDLLFRHRAAPPAVRKSRAQRQRHAEGAFFVPDHAEARLRGQRVLLLDDVVTTGATVQSCARTLLLHGADSVAVLCLCRAAPHLG